MANSSSADKIATIDKWLGLNYCPDGDVDLRVGEASKMTNWRITRSGNLRTRGGISKYMVPPENCKCTEMFRFNSDDGTDHLLVVCHRTEPIYPFTETDIIYDTAWNTDSSNWTQLFSVNGLITYHFQFREKLYVIYEIEGEYDMACTDCTRSADAMQYYVPILFIGCTPTNGSGTQFEQVNCLTNRVRAKYTTDGEATKFRVNSAGFKNIYKVRNAFGVDYILNTDYTVNGNEVTFISAPQEGVNVVEIEWELMEDQKNKILGGIFTSELYSGNTDATLFFAMRNSDEIRHLGANELGIIDPTFFPDLNVSRIGVDNDNVTGMVRHGSDLLVFKRASTWRVDWGVTTLADGNMTEQFQVIPINRDIGSSTIPELVMSNPITCFGSDIYKWQNMSQYSSQLGFSENMVVRISDRVHNKLDAIMRLCDDNYNQELWVQTRNNEFIIWNYALDVWYEYHFAKNIIGTLSTYTGEFLLLCDDGTIYEYSENYSSDDGIAISSYWESGDMNFGTPFRRKFSSMLWVTFKQEAKFHVKISTFTDRKQELRSKEISSKMFSFGDFTFENLSFNLNKEPLVKRFKLKAKKFTHYRLVIENDVNSAISTVLAVNIKFRESGEAK